jgi:hypothetical protein
VQIGRVSLPRPLPTLPHTRPPTVPLLTPLSLSRYKSDARLSPISLERMAPRAGPASAAGSRAGPSTPPRRDVARARRTRARAHRAPRRSPCLRPTRSLRTLMERKHSLCPCYVLPIPSGVGGRGSRLRRPPTRSARPTSRRLPPGRTCTWSHSSRAPRHRRCPAANGSSGERGGSAGAL